jgi:shikimate 5-dehydrogenase
MEKDMDLLGLVRQERPTMYFIGVTTGQSSMTRLFPLWVRALGLDAAQLIGLNLPLHAASEQYRKIVAHLKADPLSLGALITTHKVDLFNAAGDMLDSLDDYARLCSEVSCISRRNGRLIGHAKDPLTSRIALQEMLAPGYWQRTGAHVLCLGAGGSGIALAVNLLTLPDLSDRPERIIMVSRRQPPLDKLRAIVEQLPPGVEIEYVCNEDPLSNDPLLAALPPGSLVINATGMGKDRPGSPITDAAIFPRAGIVWELNYRGSLEFLHQAKAQEQQRALHVYDGWRYFLVSWADHIAEVFDLSITPQQFAQMVEKASLLSQH